MAKDPTGFRNRFNLYKEGKMPYENGLPKYAEGTEGWLPDYTMDYILALENPTKLGLVNGIWRPPTDSSKWDINAIGGGLDIRYKNNPLVYNFLSDNNRLNNPYLTEQEEYDLRKRTFDDTMLPALIRMHDKYGELISSKGYARLAGMKWLGHPFLMAITPDSITGRAFLNAIESGDRDLDTVFNAYYRHPANAKKYAARIQSDENYWSNNHSINLDNVPIQSTLHPIVEKRDAVTVRKTIPKAKTRARWTGAENVSPYLTGKPILKLKKEIKFPTAAEMHKESLWKPKFKDGKLPGYGGGKIPYVASDGTQYSIDPNVVGSDQINITTPEVVVTGTDRRPMYQRYDAKNSTYDPDAVRMFTDWAPVVGDISQGLDAYNAFKNNDYLLAGILGGAMLLPTAIEKPGRKLVKFGLKQFPEFTKNIYDISRLYTKIEDNPRLRRYANDVVDLLNSEQISERVAKSIDDVDIAKQISNISNTPIAFSHSNKMWIRPAITLKPLGINYTFRSPIPIQMRLAGLYDQIGKKSFIKRTGRTPDQIRLTAYHEMSHASDDALPKNVGIEFYDRKSHIEGRTPHFDLSTEKRARLLSILTDAHKHGVDINDKDAIEKFILSQDYTNHNLGSLIYDYNYFDKQEDFYDLLDNGYKDGKLPGYADGKIHIKPANRGKFTALKKRTGHSASWFKENGTPAQKKMAVFALNAKKWKH